MNKQTFHLFQRVGQNVAKREALNQYHGEFYGTRQEASQKLASFIIDFHNGDFSDESSDVLVKNGRTMMQLGDLSFEDDSRTWEYIADEDLTADDRELVATSAKL